MNRLYLFSAAVVFQGCTFDFPEEVPIVPQPVQFDIDFSNTVVLGGSIAAGYMDSALYTSGQAASYPNLILQAIDNKLFDQEITFVQPGINTEEGFDGDSNNPQGKYRISFPAPDWDILFKSRDEGVAPDVFTSASGLNNFSVPGLKVVDATNSQYDNPFFERIQSSPTSSLLDQVIQADPSFLIVDIGIEDVMNYGASGLTADGSPSPASIGKFDLTPFDTFQNELESIMSQLLNNTSAQILLFNMPDFVEFPFFQYYGHVARLTPGEAGFVGNTYAAFNREASRVGRPRIDFFADDSPFSWTIVVEDDSLFDATQLTGFPLPKMRQMEDGEEMLWSAPAPPLGIGLGTIIPVSKNYYLTEYEVSVLKELALQYNEVYQTLSQSEDRIHLFDYYSWMKSLENGTDLDGVTFSYTFDRNGIFSSDGLQLNQRGQVLLASEVIEFMNNTFNLSIVAPDVNQFPGNVFVQGF